MQLNKELLAILEYFERERGLDRQTILKAIEDGLFSVYRKRFNPDKELGEGTELHIDPATTEIYLLDAAGRRRSLPELALGRIVAQSARQMIMQKIREAEKAHLLEEYHQKVGSVVTGVVDHYEKGNLIVNLGRIEAVVPSEVLSRTERYKKKGAPVRGVITQVGDLPQHHPFSIEISTTHPAVVNDVFTREIPEIREGLIVIKAIARVPGEACKVAVFSNDSRLDPVGTCIGIRGTRIRAIMKELNGERVDVIRWRDETTELITTTFSPAKISRVDLIPDNKYSRVVVPDDQLAVAIGRRGINVKLASQLTGYTVDIISEGALKEEKLPALASLAGVDEALAQALKEQGFLSIKDIISAKLTVLAKVEGLDKEKAKELMATAKKFSEVLTE